MAPDLPFNLPPTLDQVKAARDRIAPYIRHTPLVPASALKQSITGCGDLWLKLDCLQVTGSFKARGAVNTLKSLSEAELQRGIITASGGTDGLANTNLSRAKSFAP